ncbi:WavE lipopolysaccharide synthesis family protein [Vibrio cholerae]
MIKIDDEAITFVVQGPVQASASRQQIAGITEQCLNSIRRFFPKSTIILSTWKGQPLDGLDYDQVLELDDPGANTVFYDGLPIKLNNNRQMYSTHMGLKAVKTPYAVKLRTDNLLTGRQFVELYEQYADLPRAQNYQFLTQRVLTSSTFFISSHYGHPVHFHKSDLFDFGLTQDLLTIWSDRWIPELHFTLKPGYKARHPATEQVLCLNWISALLDEEHHIESKTCDHAGLGENFWPQFMANNLLMDCPENIGLDVTERFYKRGNLALEYDFKDWLYLNGLISKNTLIDKKRIYRAYKKWTGLMIKKIHPTRVTK